LLPLRIYGGAGRESNTDRVKKYIHGGPDHPNATVRIGGASSGVTDPAAAATDAGECDDGHPGIDAAAATKRMDAKAAMTTRQ
jgi:hypothetical protein